MSSFQRFVIEVPETSDQFKSICDLASDARTGASNLSAYIASVPGGVRSANIKAKIGAVKATGLVTFTGDPVADEIVTIANVVFTAKASGATGNQFNIGANVTAHAANLAAAINASSNLTGKIVATSALGVVTLTVVVPGLLGNGVQLSEGLSNATITAFANGTDGTSYELDLD